MWKLETDTQGKRTYINDQTGSKCQMSICYTDKEKNSWYMFNDLFTIPYTRNFAALKVTSLFAAGLTADDLNGHISEMKKLLKSDDKEKYEKMYASVLDFESRIDSATSAIKQMTSLVCVYFTINDEAIDAFDGSLQMKKMALLESDPEMHSFFLSQQITLTENYTNRLSILSQIVSVPQSQSS